MRLQNKLTNDFYKYIRKLMQTTERITNNQFHVPIFCFYMLKLVARRRSVKCATFFFLFSFHISVCVYVHHMDNDSACYIVLRKLTWSRKIIKKMNTEKNLAQNVLSLF